MLLADGLVGHGGGAAAPLLAVGALAAEVLRHGVHPPGPSRLRHGHARIRGEGVRVWGGDRGGESACNGGGGDGGGGGV